MDVAFLGGAAKFFAAGSARDVAFAGSERFENRIEALHGFVGTADHHAIAAVDSPDAAAGADIDVVNAFGLELIGAAHIVFVVGVATVDDGVAGLHVLRELLHGLFRGAASGNHDPGGSRRFQFADEIFQGRGTTGAFAGQFFDGVGAEIGNYELMSAAHQAARHVRAHAAQTYHSQLHAFTPCRAKRSAVQK